MPQRAGPDVEGFDVARQRLARPAAAMAVGTALSRLTGLGRVAAMAFALGVSESRLADSYNIANTLPNVLYELVLGGVLTSVFIPVVIQELRTKPGEAAWRSVSALVTVALAVLIALSVVTVLVAPWVIDIFTARVGGAQGAEQHRLATLLLRLFAPQVALYGFVAIAEGLLNAHGRFAVPMFVPILNNLIVIGMFVAFGVLAAGVPTDATVGASSAQKLLLGLGTTGGVAAMAIACWPFVRRLPGRLRVRLDAGDPAVRKLGRLSAWTVGYVVTNAVGFVVSFYLANAVQGGPTAYVTAFAFFQLPIGIAAISVLTALTPRLSAQHVDGDLAGFRSTLARGLRLTALLLLPATAACVVLSQPLVETLLQHGVVRGHSTRLVSSVLDLFAIGLVPFAAYQLFMRGFYARQDARTPALVNVVENGVTIALDFALFPSMKVEGLALAHTLGYVAGAALAGGLLERRIGGLEARRTLSQVVRVLACSVACAAAMLAVTGAATLVAGGGERALVQLLLGAAAGLGVFLASARLLGVSDLALFRRLLPGAG